MTPDAPLLDVDVLGVPQPQGRQNVSQPVRVPLEDIVTAYRETGSIWKAAKRLGICGQSVWERLRAAGHPLASSKWTAGELDALRELAETCTIGEIARRLGRPYAGVALKMSRLEIAPNKPRAIKPKRSEMAKTLAQRYVGLLPQFRGSLRQFARSHGVAVDLLVKGLQRHFPEEWRSVAAARGLTPKPCEYCRQEFYPMTARQRSCSRHCQTHARTNRTYFGGKRQDAIGMAQGICQLCGRQQAQGLSAHHLVGKENDPENEAMVALCPGCHQVVERLATRKFVETREGWENLLQLVLLRRCGKDRRGVYACVEFEWLSDEDLDDLDEYNESSQALVSEVRA